MQRNKAEIKARFFNLMVPKGRKTSYGAIGNAEAPLDWKVGVYYNDKWVGIAAY